MTPEEYYKALNKGLAEAMQKTLKDTAVNASVSPYYVVNPASIPTEWIVKLDAHVQWVAERIKDKEDKKDVDCECGKDKHGFANHSRWCPKSHEDLQNL